MRRYRVYSPAHAHTTVDFITIICYYEIECKTIIKIMMILT